MKQIGPITRSSMRVEMGYNKSWLSHLCRTKLYARNEETGKFNESFVTYLNKNYRSHPQIVHIPNELFYENAMQALAKTGIFHLKRQLNQHNFTITNRIDFLYVILIGDVDWYVNSNLLLNKQFPFVFKAVQGSCQRAIGYNWSNESEIDEVVSFVKRFLPPNCKAEGLKKIPPWKIGVVTPYHIQNYKILQALQAINMKKVDVGTAEDFRGKQKAVMIVSTVRSKSEPFDFDVSDSENLDFVAPFAKSEVSS